MTRSDWNKYGNYIADNEASSLNGNVRDIDGIIIELEEIYTNFNTHAMSDEALRLKGKKEMLGEIITYLKRV